MPLRARPKRVRSAASEHAGVDQGRQPTLALPLGTLCPGRFGLLGLQDWKRNEHEGSVGSRRSACGRGCVGTFLSPRAPIQLPWGVVLVLQALVLASAAAGLVATGHRSLPLVFGVIVVINAILIYVWGQ